MPSSAAALAKHVGVGPSGPAPSRAGEGGAKLAAHSDVMPNAAAGSHAVNAAGTEPSDAAVVHAILAGRQDFFRLLVRRHQDAIYRHALRMVGSPDDAADITQRALVTGYRKLSACQNPEKVAGWLFRIGANLCKDYLKDRRRRNVSLDDPDVIPIDWDTPSERAERREIRDHVQEALSGLTPELQEAFVLKHVEGRSYDEMARLLDASVSALKMRVMRAREALQEALGGLK